MECKKSAARLVEPSQHRFFVNAARHVAIRYLLVFSASLRLSSRNLNPYPILRPESAQNKVNQWPLTIRFV